MSVCAQGSQASITLIRYLQLLLDAALSQDPCRCCWLTAQHDPRLDTMQIHTRAHTQKGLLIYTKIQTHTHTHTMVIYFSFIILTVCRSGQMPIEVKLSSGKRSFMFHWTLRA